MVPGVRKENKEEGETGLSTSLKFKIEGDLYEACMIQ